MLSTSTIGRDLLQFQHQPHAEPQIGGVGDADDAVEHLLVAHLAEHDFAG